MYAELISQGVQIVGGLVNFGTDLFQKLNAGKQAAQQAIKDKFIAAGNIAKAYSDIYLNYFTSVTEGASGPAWSTVKSYWDYIKKNPLPTDKKALLRGAPQPIYIMEYVASGNNSKIVLKKVTRTVKSETEIIDSDPVIIKESPMYSNDITIVKNKLILPVNYATTMTESKFDMALYDRAINYISGRNTTLLTQADVDKWKGGPTPPSTGGGDVPPPSGGGDVPPPSGGEFPVVPKNTEPKQGSSMLIILAVLGIAGYYFFSRKK